MGAPSIPLTIAKEDLSKVKIAPAPSGPVESVPVILLDGKPLPPEAKK